MNPAQLGNIEERLLKAQLWPWCYHPQRKVVLASLTREGPEKPGKIINKRAGRLVARAYLGDNKYANLEGRLDIASMAPGGDEATMLFIAHAPDDVEALITAVRSLQLQTERDSGRIEQLQHENDRLRDLLGAAEKANKEHAAFMAILKNRLRDLLE